MSNDDENKFKKLLIIGSIIGLLGAIALIIGMILQFEVFSTTSVDVFGFMIIALSLGIFFICLLTFLGTLNLGFQVNDERPGLLVLALFLFAPTIIVTNFATPMFYLLVIGNAILDLGTPAFAFYLIYIGIGLLLISFVFHTWIFLWKKRLEFFGAQSSNDEEDIGIVKVIRIIASFLILFSGIGIILGLLIPTYTSLIDPTIGSLIMSGDGSHIDLQTLFFLAEMVVVIITAIIILLCNFGLFKGVKSEIPLIFLLGIIIILPGYIPQGNTVNFWTSPIYELLVFLGRIFSEANTDITVIGWILLISIGLLFPALFLAFVSYFFNKSATPVERTTRIKAPKIKTPKKGKFPSGPPSATTTEIGGLANQLSSSSGQPSMMSGPPTGGMQPTISSAPPQPPSFMTTTQPSQADKPTCPFCGKSLRFINEYQRWYCDSCAQYV